MTAILIGSRGKELERDIQLAASTTAPVLIVGEPGVGKDAVAQLVHDRSERHDGPFVTVACCDMTDSQLEERLFGPLPTALEEAEGGTLHLDAIGAIGPTVQRQLLRLLQTKALSYETVGASPDVRIVATTSQPLFERVVAGGFLESLYYHLNIIHIVIPPLRERRDDIPAVMAGLLEDLSRHYGVPKPQLAPDALVKLQAYGWPDNLRELRGLLESLLVSGLRRTISARDLPSSLH